MNTRHSIIYFGFSILGCIGISLSIGMMGRLLSAQPSITQSYGLTLERDDFAPSHAGDTTFATSVSARSTFALIYRNGLLQRACPAGILPPTNPPSALPVPCDYSVSGNVTATFGSGMIQDGDFVTLIFQR